MEVVKTPKDYIGNVPEKWRDAYEKLRLVILKNIPEGFEETIQYGMIAYVVPHKIYKDGYHCEPKEPLPFLSIAAQKNHISLYHSGIYVDNKLSEWFQGEYPKYVKTKLDMGKSCIRFKNPKNIPYDLISELVGKMTVEDWIKIYEKNINK